MSRVLVTGGAGFIGSHLVEALLREGHTVTVLDDFSGGTMANLLEAERASGGGTFERGHLAVRKDSILDTLTVNALMEDQEYVFHCAAYAAEGLSHFVRRFNYQTNLVGSINLITAAVKHQVKRFLFTSSIAVYGSQAGKLNALFDEETPAAPEDPYGIAKYAVELDLKAAHEMFGLEYTILRPHNVYGPRQNLNDRYRNVVGIFMKQMLAGEALTVFGDGHQTRSFTYIDDIIPTMVKAMTSKLAANQIYNLGNVRGHSIRQLIDALHTLMTGFAVRHVAARNEVSHAHADDDKTQNAFGPIEYTRLEDGLKKMWEWAKTMPAGANCCSPPYELTKNMPESWLVKP